MKWDVKIGDDFHFHGSGNDPDSFEGEITKIFYGEVAPVIVVRDEFQDCLRVIDLGQCLPCSQNENET